MKIKILSIATCLTRYRSFILFDVRYQKIRVLKVINECYTEIAWRRTGFARNLS